MRACSREPDNEKDATRAERWTALSKLIAGVFGCTWRSGGQSNPVYLSGQIEIYIGLSIFIFAATLAHNVYHLNRFIHPGGSIIIPIKNEFFRKNPANDPAFGF